MEDRVKACSEENEELKKKLELMENQNKTLAGQLRRLHQIIVNGGVKQTQKSTAMMVLLLSTALFLIPGFKESGKKFIELFRKVARLIFVSLFLVLLNRI